MNIEKTILSEIRKWGSFNMNIFFINDKIYHYYYKSFLGDYDDKKSLLFDCIILKC